jgi:hypothetical protein
MTTPAPKKPGAVNNTDRPSTGECWTEAKAEERWAIHRSGEFHLCGANRCFDAFHVLAGIAIERKRQETALAAERRSAEAYRQVAAMEIEYGGATRRPGETVRQFFDRIKREKLALVDAEAQRILLAPSQPAQEKRDKEGA